LVAKKRLIGIVDDEFDIVQLYRDALIASGFSVFAFTNPLIAFEHFKVNKKSYVLIISDLRMPGLDGIGLIKKVKNMNPDIRTILVTAFEVDDNIFEQYTRENIIDGFLQKPITLRDLVTEVENQLRIHRLQEQKQKT
jgi:DNA-binding NtrC family response regulator